MWYLVIEASNSVNIRKEWNFSKLKKKGASLILLVASISK
jgi:hypothetical protein